jgi:hypothetical protein
MVTVSGQNFNEDGLAMALESHIETAAKNGIALLNIADREAAIRRGEDPAQIKINAPRPAYVHQPFPKHLYHADGRDKVVADENEMALSLDQGFRAEPYRTVKATPGDPAVEKAKLEAQLAHKDGQIATLADEFTKLKAQVEALTSKKSK